MSVCVEILNITEYSSQKAADDEKCRLFLCNMDNYHYCKVELLEKGVVGTIVIPDKRDIIHKEICFGFYFVDNFLFFLDNTGLVKRIFDEKIRESYDTSEELFFHFLEYLINDEIIFLKYYEENMNRLEDVLMSYKGEDISKEIIQYRQELQRFQSCYQHLMDVSDILKMQFFIFEKLSSRIENILIRIKELGGYSLQIRDLYQTQISVRQNKVMQMLTVITTIFMPLNLLTGWYGMNFIGMQELDWNYGYLCFIILSIMIVVVEVYYFRKKKWFL